MCVFHEPRTLPALAPRSVTGRRGFQWNLSWSLIRLPSVLGSELASRCVQGCWRRSRSGQRFGGRGSESTVSQLLLPFLRGNRQCLSSGRHSDTSPDASQTTWIIRNYLWANFTMEDRKSEGGRAIHQSARNHSHQQLLIRRKLELCCHCTFIDNNDRAICIPVGDLRALIQKLLTSVLIKGCQPKCSEPLLKLK